VERKPVEVIFSNRIVSRKDVLKAARELERIRDALIASSVNHEPAQPMISDRVRSLLEANNIRELTSDSADKLVKQLEYAVDHVPMLRFIFAAEPDVDFQHKLIDWMRNELHPASLMLYSIQPQIAGGYILTTDNHRYDHSWKYLLNSQPAKFGKALRA